MGATCISSPGTGFICVCPLGSHGLFCEEGKKRWYHMHAFHRTAIFSTYSVNYNITKL